MTSTIPAAPGARLLWRSGDGHESRVLIGWEVAPGKRPAPVTIGPVLVSLTETCVDDAGDFISLKTGVIYDSFEDWAAAEDGAAAPEAPILPTGSTFTTFSNLDILRTDKGFKKQSFWRFTGPEAAPFMFIVEAGDFIPEDPRVVKITRDVFSANKANEQVVPYNTVFGIGKAAEVDTDQRDDAAEAEALGADDEGEDLI